MPNLEPVIIKPKETYPDYADDEFEDDMPDNFLIFLFDKVKGKLKGNMKGSIKPNAKPNVKLNLLKR